MRAAKSEFSHRGLEAAKVGLIAHQADVSRTYIYKRFASKLELYAAIRNTVEPELYEVLTDFDYDTPGFWSVVEEFLDRLYACYEATPVLTSMMRDQLIHGTDLFQRSDVVGAALQQLKHRLSMLLDRGRAEGEIDCDWDGGTFLFLSSFIVMGALSDIDVRGSLIGRAAFAVSTEPRHTQVTALFIRALRRRAEPEPERRVTVAVPQQTSTTSSEPSSVDVILDAAERCFGAKGLDCTSMGDVGAAAGLSTQLVYYYFNSKRELYAGVVDRLAQRSIFVLLQPGWESADALGALRNFLKDWWRQYAEHPAYALLAVDQSLQGNCITPASNTSWARNVLMKRLDVLLRRATERGSIHPATDVATFCFLGVSLIPLAVAASPDGSPRGTARLYQPMTLQPATILDFIVRCLVP